MYDIASARVAFEFLHSEMPLESFAAKYSQGLSGTYADVPDESLLGAAQGMLEFLAEIEAGTNALGRGFTAETEARQSAHTVGEVLAWMNTDAALNANLDFYLAYSIRRRSPDGSAAGAYTVGNWYTRNILILSNLLHELEGHVCPSA